MLLETILYEEYASQYHASFAGRQMEQIDPDTGFFFLNSEVYQTLLAHLPDTDIGTLSLVAKDPRTLVREHTQGGLFWYNRLYTLLDLDPIKFPLPEGISHRSLYLDIASHPSMVENVKRYMADGMQADEASELIILGSKNNMPTVIKLALAGGGDPTLDYGYAIRYTSDSGHTKVVRLLVGDELADSSIGGNYAIKYASENGHTEVVRLLLGDGRVNPSAQDNYAIIHASENGHTEVVRLLLQDERADPSADNNYSIKRSSERGHTEVVRLLLDALMNEQSIRRLAYTQDI